MSDNVRSLHARLLVVIIVPVLLVAAILSVIRYYEVRQTTQQIYDTSLLSIAHVIARDVVLNQGDLLAERLLETLTDALGDQVFYHIVSDQAPPLLSGYTPPPTSDEKSKDLRTPVFFDSEFRDQLVRAVSFREYFTANNIEGSVTVTVWQNTGQRQNLTLKLTGRGLITLILVILATAFIVWFGVTNGLKPLLDLQSAIAKRSPDDMSPIKRAVPREVSSLVGATNNLFAQVRNSFAEKDAFIANAAHQLRNPIAGLLSQAEAAERTNDPALLKERVKDVAEAARRTARLTQQLLSMERVSHGAALENFESFDVVSLVQKQLAIGAASAFKQGVDLSLMGGEAAVFVKGNSILIGEAFDNLLDNALRYGADGGKIETKISTSEQTVTISVIDEGAGLDEALLPIVFDRFTRGAEDGSDGCGLGLAIAQSIVRKHGGDLQLKCSTAGTQAIISLPCIKPSANQTPQNAIGKPKES